MGPHVALGVYLLSGCSAHSVDRSEVLRGVGIDRDPAPLEAPSLAPSAADSGTIFPRCVTRTPITRPPVLNLGAEQVCPAVSGSPSLRRTRVGFETTGVSVDVELAETVADRDRGLMYRTELPEDEGMLFVFTERAAHTFWMENTCIPLDIVFIDEDGFVVGIVENAPVMDTEDIGVPCPSMFVLEVNAGWTRRHGIKAGMTATGMTAKRDAP